MNARMSEFDAVLVFDPVASTGFETVSATDFLLDAVFLPRGSSSRPEIDCTSLIYSDI